MRLARRTRGAAILAALGAVVAGCAQHPPLPSTTVAPTQAGIPSPSAAPAIPIHIRFEGRVNCNIGFSFACGPRLSVLDAGTPVPASWRPSATDPQWDTRGGGMQDVKASRWPRLRGGPAAGPGRHLLVVSLIGASDVVSFNPDGSVATELLARCSADVDVAPDADALNLLVTFVPRPDSTLATCTVGIEGD